MARVALASALVGAASGLRLVKPASAEVNASSSAQWQAWECRNACLFQQALGSCFFSGSSCQWCPNGAVGGRTLENRWCSAVPSPRVFSGWQRGRWCAGACTGIGKAPAPSPPPPAPKWKLEWADEFNDCPNGRPDPANWGYESGYVRNREYQWYQEDNAKCVDGHLVISARRENPPDWVSWGPSKDGKNYTASSLHSRGRKQFDYGRYEMRGKIPIDAGSWPAWWVVGDVMDRQYKHGGNITWPDNGEIDMMEYYRGTVLHNFCYGNNRSKPIWSSHKKPVDGAWASRFHVWAMEWDAQSVSIFLDGEVMNTFKVSTADGTGHLNPYRGEPWFMRFNFAIGGTSGGDPSRTRFPLDYYVDYVRYYRKA